MTTDATKKQLKSIRRIFSDVYGFVRGREANKALASVSQEQLISDQLLSNGLSAANASRYNPYDINPTTATPASGTASSVPVASPVNPIFAGVPPTGGFSRLDELEAMKNVLDEAIKSIKMIDPAILDEEAGRGTESDQLRGQGTR